MIFDEQVGTYQQLSAVCVPRFLLMRLMQQLSMLISFSRSINSYQIENPKRPDHHTLVLASHDDPLAKAGTRAAKGLIERSDKSNL
jgi:hypothetical protein